MTDTAFKDYRKKSREIWGTRHDNLSDDQLKIGAMLRIADATELMAQRHAELIRERDFYEKRSGERYDALRAEQRRNIALRGQITKLRRQLAALKTASSN